MRRIMTMLVTTMLAASMLAARAEARGGGAHIGGFGGAASASVTTWPTAQASVTPQRTVSGVSGLAMVACLTMAWTVTIPTTNIRHITGRPTAVDPLVQRALTAQIRKSVLE
jgi:hypothetical protein